MEIAFGSRKLRDICINKDKAVEVLGPQVARMLITTLADIRAAGNIIDLPYEVYFVDSFEKNNVVCSIKLTDFCCIELVSNHVLSAAPKLSSDWVSVYRLKLICITGVK